MPQSKAALAALEFAAGVRAEIDDESDCCHMTLMGDVGWDIDAAEVAVALKAAKGKPVHVDIFSYGGDAMMGLAIHQMLAQHDGAVTTNVLGVAASAASVIAMAGSRRIVPSNGALMIHPAWGVTMGNAEEHRKHADVLEGITSAYLRTYAAASGRPAEEIEPYLSQEAWLYGEDAMALGLATEVAEPIMAMATGPCIGDDRATRIPENLMALAPIRRPAPRAEKITNLTDENNAECGQPAAPSAMTVEIPTTNDAAAAARQSERERMSAIRGLCKRHEMTEEFTETLLNSDCDVSEARAAVLDKIGAPKMSFTPGGVADSGRAEIGMSDKEIAAYSFRKLFAYMADPNSQTRDEAGLELEVSRAAADKQNASPKGEVVAWDILAKGWRPRATQQVGTFNTGGALVPTEYLSGSFIDLMRNQSSFMRAGVTMLTGLTGNVEIPKKLTSTVAYFLAEGEETTETDATFGLVNMTPKTVSGAAAISRRMLKQSSPDIDALIRDDLFETIAIAMDLNIGYGPGGSSRPQGILNTTGIGAVTLAAGVAKTFPASLGGGSHNCGSWGDYVDMEAAIAVNNLDIGTMNYLLNTVVRGGLKQTLKSSVAGSQYIFGDDNRINGYGTVVSNQLNSNDVLMGNFSDCVVGMWGGLDLLVDPYTKSKSGEVKIIVHQDFDVAVRRAQSFCLAS